MTSKKIKITDDYISLGQFLKVADLIGSGGEAKVFLMNNEVLVNDEKETRRGRKLYRNDKIRIGKEEYEIC